MPDAALRCLRVKLLRGAAAPRPASASAAARRSTSARRRYPVASATPSAMTPPATPAYSATQNAPAGPSHAPIAASSFTSPPPSPPSANGTMNASAPMQPAQRRAAKAGPAARHPGVHQRRAGRAERQHVGDAAAAQIGDAGREPNAHGDRRFQRKEFASRITVLEDSGSRGCSPGCPTRRTLKPIAVWIAGKSRTPAMAMIDASNPYSIRSCPESSRSQRRKNRPFICLQTTVEAGAWTARSPRATRCP